MISIAFLLLACASLYPAVPSALALVGGMAFALILQNPFPQETKKLTPLLLQLSVIGIGGAMDFHAISAAGKQGFLYTILGISLTLALGYALGRAAKVGNNTSLLVSSGTAICGGSAIAAVASVIAAKPAEISVSLVVVFLLNAIALLLFPPLGHAFGLSEHQFGLWSALAIHDTSSVVGAALQYGPHALEVATTVKLARALWILPLAAVLAWQRSRQSGASLAKIKKPWFILGFLLLAALVTWVPALQAPGLLIAMGARRTLVLTLFLIGSGLSRSTLKEVGMRPFLQGVMLWLVVAGGTLGAIQIGWIH